MSKDGQTAMTGNLQMGTNAITGATDVGTATVTATGAISAGGTVTGTALIPTGASVPANGVYLSAANTLAWATNTTIRYSVNATGNHTIAAPSGGGSTLSLTGNTGAAALAITQGSGAVGIRITDPGANGTTLDLDTTNTSAIISPSGTSAVSLNLRTNTSDRLVIGTAGNVTIAAPSSGTALAVTGLASNTAQSWTDGTRTIQVAMATRGQIGTSSSHDLALLGGGTERVIVGSSGNITVNAPSSGTTLTLNQTGSGPLIENVGSTGAQRFMHLGMTGGDAYIGTGGSTGGSLITGSAAYSMELRNDTGFWFGIGTAAAVSIDSTKTLKAADDAGTLQTVGWRDMPQNASTAVTLALSDRGKHVYANGTTSTVAIPANGTVAFPVGTTIILVNDGSGNMTVSITTDTLAWLQGGSVSTGTRTVATSSVVTLVKVTSTRWIISGSGIS